MRLALLALCFSAILGCEDQLIYFDLESRPDGLKFLAAVEEGELVASRGPLRVENGVVEAELPISFEVGEGEPYLVEVSTSVLEHPLGVVLPDALALERNSESEALSAMGSLLTVREDFGAETEVFRLSEEGALEAAALEAVGARLARTIETEPCDPPLGFELMFPQTPEVLAGYGTDAAGEHVVTVLDVGADTVVVARHRILLIRSDALPAAEPSRFYLSDGGGRFETLTVLAAVDARPESGIILLGPETIYRLEVEPEGLRLRTVATSENLILSDAPAMDAGGPCLGSDTPSPPPRLRGLGWTSRATTMAGASTAPGWWRRAEIGSPWPSDPSWRCAKARDGGPSTWG